MEYQNINEMEPKELFGGMKARFVHSENMTFNAFWDYQRLLIEFPT